MKTTYKTGLDAEKLCRLALRLKCYRIVASRYKTSMGEVDLIAARGKNLIAVEVKARANADSALLSISPRQRQRIAGALQNFVQRHPRYATHHMRFDIMLAVPRRWPVHILNAWHAD